MFARTIPLLLLLMGVFLIGCASSLSTVQPARLTPKGHAQLLGTANLTLPVASPGDALNAAQELNLRGRLTPDRVAQIANTSAELLLAPPAIDGQIAFSYGISKRFELNARVSGLGIGVGARFQFMRRKPGIYGALGIAFDFSFASVGIDKFSDRIDVTSNRRQSVSFPLVVGYSRKHIHLWLGPKLVLARYAAQIEVCIDGTACREKGTIDVGAQAGFIAGQLGIALGGGRFWVAAELSIAHMFARGDVDLSAAGNSAQLSLTRSGRVITPALGFIGWF